MLIRALAVALVGVLAGGLATALTVALSRSSIGGPGWSLRGNGALVVPLAVEPAILAAGWTLLARAKQRQRLRTAILAGLAVLVLELAFTFGPILLGPIGAATFRVGILAVPVLLAAAIGVALARGGLLAAGLASLLALALSLLVPGLGFVLVPLLLPVVLVAPLVAGRWLGAVVLDGALLLGMIVGTLGGQIVFGAG